jgi:hypothetical protein
VAWYWGRAYATLAVASVLIAVYVLLRFFVETRNLDAVNLGLILQRDWFRRGGLQWFALFANGFVTLSLHSLATTVVLVLACMPWLEKRIGSRAALGLVFLLAWTLGPIKIALGAPGAVGASKITLMLQIFWLADNPLLLWVAARLGAAAARGPPGRPAAALVFLVRHLGWAPAAWIAWDELWGGNAAHALSAAAGLVVAAFLLRRPSPLFAASEKSPPSRPKNNQVPP